MAATGGCTLMQGRVPRCARGLRTHRALVTTLQRPVLGVAASRKVTSCKANKKDQDNQSKVEEGVGNNPKVDRVVNELKRKGVTPAKAAEMLKVWADLGVQTPEQLRKLLVKKSLTPATGLVIQTLLDAVAAVGGLIVGSMAGGAEPFTGRVAIELLAYFAGCYYVIQVLFELSALVGMLMVANKYNTSTTEVLAAVQKVAGPLSTFSVTSTASLPVNSIKVLQTLQYIANLLKEMADSPPADNSTLDNLSAYLTLNRAKELYNFNPSEYDMSDEAASRMALVFARYDVNDEGKLGVRELKRLCESMDKELTEAEYKEAVKVLDLNKSGWVEFNEFVDWWTNRNPAIA